MAFQPPSVTSPQVNPVLMALFEDNPLTLPDGQPKAAAQNDDQPKELDQYQHDPENFTQQHSPSNEDKKQALPLSLAQDTNVPYQQFVSAQNTEPDGSLDQAQPATFSPDIAARKGARDSSILELLRSAKPKASNSAPYSAGSPTMPMPSVPQAPPAPAPPSMPYLPTTFDNASVVSGFRDHRDSSPPPPAAKSNNSHGSNEARNYLLAMLSGKPASGSNSPASNNTFPAVSSPPMAQNTAVFAPSAPPSNSGPGVDKRENSIGSRNDQGQKQNSLPDDIRVVDSPKQAALARPKTSDHKSAVSSDNTKAGTPEASSPQSSVETFLFPLSPFCSITLKTKPEGIEPLRTSQNSPVIDFSIPLNRDLFDGRSLITTSNNSLVYASSERRHGASVYSSRAGTVSDLPGIIEPVFDVSIYSEQDVTTPFSEYVLATSPQSKTVYWSQLQGPWGGTTVAFQLSISESEQIKAKKSETHGDVFAVSCGSYVRVVHPLKEIEGLSPDQSGAIRTSLSLQPNLCIDAGDVIADFAFSCDDTTLVTFGTNGVLKFWDLRASQTRTTVVDPVRQHISTDPLRAYDTILDPAYQPSSVMFIDLEKPYMEKNPHRYTLLGFQQNHLLQLWDLQLGKCVQELRLPYVSEYDQMCRLSYHTQSGFLCVFHPTRNSFFVLSLSFPQYRRLEKAPTGMLSRSTFENLSQTQAGYLTLISSHKEARPPENTVIMKGVSEVSLSTASPFIDFGIRNVEPTPRSDGFEEGSEKTYGRTRRGKKKTEQHTLFELFFLHQSGISSVVVKPEDVGYHTGLKPILSIEPNNNEFLSLTSMSKAVSPTLMPRSHMQRSGTLVEVGTNAQNVKGHSDVARISKSSHGKASERTAIQSQQPASQPVNENEGPVYQSVLDEDADYTFDAAPVAPVPSAPKAKAPENTVSTSNLEAHLSSKFDQLSNLLLDRHQSFVSSTLGEVQHRTSKFEDTIRRTLSQTAQSQLKASSSGIDRVVKRAVDDLQAEFKAASEALVSDVRTAIESSANSMKHSIIKSITEQVNSAISTASERAADRATEEMMKVISEQMEHSQVRNKRNEEKIDRLVEMVSTMASMTNKSDSSSEQEPIRQYLRDSSPEDAVLSWLGSAKKIELFDDLFIDLGPEFTTKLTPVSALAVTAVVTLSLDGPNAKYRLKWVSFILQHLESSLKTSCDSELLGIIPHVMSILTSRLEAARARARESGNMTLLDLINSTRRQIDDFSASGEAAAWLERHNNGHRTGGHSRNEAGDRDLGFVL